MVEKFDRERAGALAEKSEEELGMPGGLVLKGNDFDSDSDGHGSGDSRWLRYCDWREV